MSNAAPPGEMPRTRLVLADDHAGLLDEVRSLLVPDFDVVAAVSDGAGLVKAAAELRPDAVIADIRMPVLGGLEASREILKGGYCAAIVLLTTYNEPEIVARALGLGIRGYVLKVHAADELVPTLRRALAGHCYLSQGVPSAAVG